MAMTSLDFLIDHVRQDRNRPHQQTRRTEVTEPEQREFRALVSDLLEKDSRSMDDMLREDPSLSMDDPEAGAEQRALSDAMGLAQSQALSLVDTLRSTPGHDVPQDLGTQIRLPITAQRPAPAPSSPTPLSAVTAEPPEGDAVRLPITATRPNHFAAAVEDPAKPASLRMPGAARATRTEPDAAVPGHGPTEQLPPNAATQTDNEPVSPSAQSAAGPGGIFGPPEARAATLKPSAVEHLGQSVRMPVRTTYVSSTPFDDIAPEKSEVVRRTLRNTGYADTVARDRQTTLGSLTARFESGPEGVAAIGYDRMGGTSYGTYQLSSRAGTMDRFIDYLKTEEPAWAERLESAGPANTRSRRGAMPAEWRAIADESPERFEAVQEKFILKTSYKPALEAIKTSADVNVAELSHAVQEVLHSTAVQHGANGAARIFTLAARAAGSPEEAGFEKRLIEAVYDRRKQNFGGSTHDVRVAVKARLSREKTMALALLEEGVKKVA